MAGESAFPTILLLPRSLLAQSSFIFCDIAFVLCRMRHAAIIFDVFCAFGTAAFRAHDGDDDDDDDDDEEDNDEEEEVYESVFTKSKLLCFLCF
jgi:hypothetical protein